MRRGSPILIILPLLALLFFLRAHKAPRTLPQNDRPPYSFRRSPKQQSDPNQQRYPNQQSDVQRPESCASLNITCGSQYFHQWQAARPGDCVFGTSHGYPLPDPKCTPGGFNPAVTETTLGTRGWSTKCLRDCESSEADKHIAYSWYSQIKPRYNNGPTQVCELDHLVPLNLGGSDGLGNIWPECGPANAQLEDRYFKEKDKVEDYLVNQVRSGRMQLADAQRGIARDWTQYLGAARHYCESGGRC